MFVNDENRCIGCKRCEMICSIHHEDVINPKKARIAVQGEYEKSFKISACVGCGTCYEVCPVNAIYKTNGYYQIDKEKCTNCEKCVEECPTNCISTHPELETPVGICDFCGDCVEICPVDALEIVGLENE